MSVMTDKIMNAEHVSNYTITMPNNDLVVENAELVFKNLEARGTKANPVGGKRTVCLMLSREWADRLWNEGWNVKVKEIKDEYQEDEVTMNVKWPEFVNQYQDVFDNAMPYTEIIVNENGNPPAHIYKASEFNGEKTVAPIPVDHWKDLDKSVLSDVMMTIHPWQHGRDPMKPEAKKGYLKSMIAKVQPITNGLDLGNTYADFRVVGI